MRRSFTLIELLAAVSISAVVLSAAAHSFLAFHRSFSRALDRADIVQSRQIVIREITRDSRGAEKMVVESGSVTFVIKEGSVSYDMKDNKVRRREGSFSAYLTDENKVKELRFALVSPRLLRISADSSTTEVFCRNE